MRKALVVLFGLALSFEVNAGASEASAPPIAHAQALFMERCGGCHGLRGLSVAENVPDLAGVAGYFLCNSDSRAFAASLPNVVFARLPDEDLAAVLNYVMFDLGGPSVPKGARPYSAAELARYRGAPLAVSDLHAQRREIVKTLVAECGAPEKLLDYQRQRGLIAPAPKET